MLLLLLVLLLHVVDTVFVIIVGAFISIIAAAFLCTY